MIRNAFYSLFLFASAMSAQDLGGGGKLIPAGSSTSGLSPTPAPTGSALDWKVEEKDDRPLTTGASPGLMPSKEQFVNTSKEYTKQMNDKMRFELTPTTDVSFASNGGSIGYINTDATFVILQYRDFGEVDGDCVRVMVNGKIVRDKICLGGNFSSFRLDLEDGKNDIIFTALNAGQVSPNTAQLQVMDDKGRNIGGGGWNLDSGSSARLTVVKR